MPSDLDMLIDYYQWEVVRIKASIEENLKLHFYREVEFDERALAYAHQQLAILLELKKPMHPQAKKAKEMIRMYERMGTNGSVKWGKKFYSEYIAPKIQEQKKIIESLANIPIESGKEETQEIDHAIFYIIQEKNSCFLLHLDNEVGAKIKVSFLGELKFKIEFQSNTDELWWFKKYSILNEMNFRLSEDKTRLVRCLTIQNNKNVLPLKEFLAKIIIGLKPHLRLGSYIYLELI